MDADQERLLLLEAEIERRALIEDRERRLRAPLAKARPEPSAKRIEVRSASR
jgi:hypothetical protein